MRFSCFVLANVFILGLTSVPAAFSITNEALFREAGSAETREKTDDAINSYKKLIAQSAGKSLSDPLVLRSQVRLARLYLAGGKIKEAEPAYLAALKNVSDQAKKDPELMIDMDDLAETYSSLGKSEMTGETLLQHALELRKTIDPRHPNVNESYRQMAQHMIILRNLPAAEKYINIVIEREKGADTPDKLNRLVTDRNLLLGIYIFENRWHDTEIMAKAVLADTVSHPTLHWAWPGLHCTLAKCYTRRQQYDQSDAEYKIAQDLIIKYPYAQGVIAAECAKGMAENKLLRSKARPVRSPKAH